MCVHLQHRSDCKNSERKIQLDFLRLLPYMRRNGSPLHICAKNICRLIRGHFMYLVDCSKKKTRYVTILEPILCIPCVRSMYALY